VGANVQAAMLIEGPPAVYPEMARRARIQGVVRIELTVGKEGGISNMRVMSGHPLLVPAAMEAVKQYRYRPTLLNGAPVEVISTVDVPFTLNRQ
jgi:protein TonB